MRDERLCLVSPAQEAPAGPVTLRQLSKYPLVMPERGHSFRKLMESAAAMAGVQLRIECLCQRYRFEHGLRGRVGSVGAYHDGSLHVR